MRNIYHNVKFGLASKPRLMNLNEIQSMKIPENQDVYISIFKYNEEQKKNAESSNSVASIKDVITDTLVWDFDSEDDIEKARLDTLKLGKRLVEEYNVDPDIIYCYTSGNKGFHVILPINKEITPEQFKQAITRLADGLETFDSSVSDHARILRLEHTKHPKSGLYKIPLHLAEIEEMDTTSIKNLAKTDRDESLAGFKEGSAILPEKLFIIPETKKRELIEDLTESFANPPKGWKEYKWALAQGMFDSGERHQALMVIAATCRSLGYDKESTYYICKSALKKQAARTGQEEFSKEELWNNIIEDSVFSDRWEGGSYSPQNNPWLKSYCEKHGFKTEEKEDPPCLDLDILTDQFTNYATNFEQNIIKTGIKGLDDNVIFSTSTLNGILGQPGCHAKGTEIMMADGSIKKVENVKVGDLLMGPDSKPREVLKLQRGRDRMVKIIPIKGEPFVINQHHILNLKPSTGTNNKAFECNLNIMFKDYIEKTSKVVKNRYKINRVAIQFDEKSLSIDPYILGCWLGDGTSSEPAITNVDTEILNAFFKYCKSIGDEIVQRSEITYYSKGNNFRKKLKKLNLIDNKHIPFSYLTGSRNQRLQLLAGLLDTDGSLEVNKTHFDFINKNKKIAEGVVYLCRSLGLAAYLTECKKGCYYKEEYKEGNYFRVSISGDCSVIPTLCKRKRAKPRKQIKDVLVTGFKYEYLNNDDYYGFTLDKDHLYLTSDFIVHHNSGKTTMALNYLRNTSLAGIPSMFFSLDMGAPLVYAKLVQKATGYTFKKALELYRTNPKERERISNIIKTEYKNVGFNFKSGLTVTDMLNAINKQTERTGIKPKLIVIDYLENIAGPYSDATANAGLIANQLKDLANETETCVTLLLQTQKHSTPDISDPLLSMKQIKGSSVIEQACSTVLTLWREGYSPNTVGDDKYISFAIVKNRFGPLWQDDFYWEPIRGDIKSLSEEQREDLEEFRKYKKDQKLKETQETSGWQ